MIAPNMTSEHIHTAEEVARILRVNTRTVHRLIKRGELEAFTIGGIYRIYQSSVDDYIARRSRPRKDT